MLSECPFVALVYKTNIDRDRLMGLGLLFFVSGGFLFVIYMYQYFVFLLGLEVLLLGVWLLYLDVLSWSVLYLFFFLVLVVCMGGVGLGVLVGCVRLLVGDLFFLF